MFPKLSLFLLFGCCLCLASEYHQYDGLSVIRVRPKNHFQLLSLLELEQDHNDEPGVDFWRRPDKVNRFADLMLTPDNRDRVRRFLHKRNIHYEILVDDVKTAIELERVQLERAAKMARTARNANANETIPGFWAVYQRLAQIEKLTEMLAEENPQLVQKIKFGSSYEGRPLSLVRIGVDSNDEKPAVFVEGGIHAREWISPAMVTYLIQQLVNGHKNGDAAIMELLKTFDFYIVPVLNPDGYEYSHTSYRLWRKTRSTSGSCKGTDPNRNYGYKWGYSGSSNNPCSETYRGKAAFSESETKAESDFIYGQLKGRAKVFLAVHSYGQYWIYPWGYASELTKDDAELGAKAKIAADAVAKRYQTKYTIGTSTNVLYAAAGAADDWAYGNASITYSYTVELRDTGDYGFQLPANQIIPASQEATDGVLAMLAAVKQTLNL